MANKFVNIVILCLFSMIIRTITTAPVDSSKNGFGKGFSGNLLKIFNNNTPIRGAYRSGKVTEIKKVPNDENRPLYKITMSFEPKCAKNSQCFREICNVVVENTPGTVLLKSTVRKPMKCYNDLSTTVLNRVDERIKREVGDEDSDDDPIMDEYANQMYLDEDSFNSQYSI